MHFTAYFQIFLVDPAQGISLFVAL